MKRQRLRSISLLAVIGLAGCGEQPAQPTGGGATPSTSASTAASASSNPPSGRWYTRAQVERGNGLFQTHCAECHKPDASGTPEWRSLDANGKLPPPPLNGTAHAWHHPLSVLRRTVRIGGVPLGGSMPAFQDKLSAAQIDDILAWVQSQWPEEVYRIWQERDTQAVNQLQSLKKGG